MVRITEADLAQYQSKGAVPKPSKYHNKRVEIDGFVFASKAEAIRYQELKLHQQAQAIAHLRVHPGFELIVGDLTICWYEADFSYIDEDGSLVVEDVKGVRTASYVIKRKLMKAIHNIDIVEVKPARKRWRTK